MSGFQQPPQMGQGSASAPDPTAMMRYDANKKSLGVAYLLWFFLGMIGAHRFYLQQTGTAVAMLALFIVSLLLTFVLIGALGLVAVWIWWIVDAFLIPGIVAALNNQLINQITR